MKIIVCIGSACHIKGSRQIVEQFQYLIQEKGLDGKIELGGRSCMGSCRRGVCVTVDEELFTVSPDTARRFFEETVMPRVTP